jgi:hypothetical protein
MLEGGHHTPEGRHSEGAARNGASVAEHRKQEARGRKESHTPLEGGHLVHVGRGHNHDRCGPVRTREHRGERKLFSVQKVCFSARCPVQFCGGALCSVQVLTREGPRSWSRPWPCANSAKIE